MMRIVIAALLTTFALAAKKEFQNLSYLGRGYNVLTGNPGSASDYGVESAIFEIKYSDEGKNLLGVDAMRTPSCDMMFKSYRITDMKTYTDELKLSVSGEIGLVQAPFSANLEYSTLGETMTNHSSVFVETVADCEQYSARLNVYDNMAPYTKNFQSAISMLPSFYDNRDRECVQAFFEFFVEFGTHVVVQVSMGTKLVLRHEMNESKFRALEGKGVSIDVAASIFSILQFDPVPAEYPFISSELLEKEAALFGKKRTSTMVISKGAKVPHDANLDQWLKDSSKDPALLRFQLDPMHYFVPEHLRTAIQEATKDLCKYVPNAKCDAIFTEPKKLDPLCPTVAYFGQWESRHLCFKGDKPAPPAPVAEVICPNGNAMAGIRFSHRRLPLKRSFTGMADIGCTNIVDIGTKLSSHQWTEPNRKRNAVFECPRGQIVSGIRFSHKCSSNLLEKEYVSIRCAKVSSTIGNCQTTEWDKPGTLPAWSETSCPLGTVIKGLQFRYERDQEMYRLRCCEVGRVRCTGLLENVQ